MIEVAGLIWIGSHEPVIVAGGVPALQSPNMAAQGGNLELKEGSGGTDGGQRRPTRDAAGGRCLPVTCEADRPGDPAGRGRCGRISAEQGIGGEEGIRTLDTALDRITV